MLTPPSSGDTRCALADWMEMKALLRSDQTAPVAILRGLLELDEDSAETPADWLDEVANEILDGEIAEIHSDGIVESVFDELEYRERVAGEAYPYVVERTGPTLRLRSTGIRENAGNGVYIFCLIVSQYRERRVTGSISGVSDTDLGGMFQVCACLAAGGYLGGEVVSFGFPREERTGFEAALKGAYRRFGAGRVRERFTPEYQLHHQKDAGIDVIAWLDHPDRLPGKLYILGQCASGLNWREKSVTEEMRSFHDVWFEEKPSTLPIPAMFIPFIAHREFLPVSGDAFLESVRRQYWLNEARFGILFDRLRLAVYADRCVRGRDAGSPEVDGINKLSTVMDWMLGQLAEAREQDSLA